MPALGSPRPHHMGCGNAPKESDGRDDLSGAYAGRRQEADSTEQDKLQTLRGRRPLREHPLRQQEALTQLPLPLQLKGKFRYLPQKQKWQNIPVYPAPYLRRADHAR